MYKSHETSICQRGSHGKDGREGEEGKELWAGSDCRDGNGSEEEYGLGHRPFFNARDVCVYAEWMDYVF